MGMPSTRALCAVSRDRTTTYKAESITPQFETLAIRITKHIKLPKHDEGGEVNGDRMG